VRKAKNLPFRKLNLPTFSEPSKESSVFIRWVGGFFFFWYDFIIGDDWRVAAGIVAGFFAINAVGPTSWWLMPVVVALMLGFTLLEATRPTTVAA
jgi:hypothetical protein